MTLLATLVTTSAEVAATSSRLSKVRSIAALLRALAPEEIRIAVLYLSGALPQGRTGIGYRTLQSAAAEAGAGTGALTLGETDRLIAELAGLRGPGSAARRTQALRALFALATTDEQRFLIRLLVGELRQGALEGVMVDAIASAATMPVADVRRAAMYAGDLGTLARAALVDGADALQRFQLQLFAPVAPMLAQTAADPAEALDVLNGPVDFEWKMDGARIQVHRSGDEVRIYTRALNDVTAAVPEIVAAVRALPLQQMILDGEAIAFTANGRPQPFQVTMRRFGRKLDVEKMLRSCRCGPISSTACVPAIAISTGRPLRERLAALARGRAGDACASRGSKPACAAEAERVLRRGDRDRPRRPDGEGARLRRTRRAIAARAGSRSSGRTRSTSSCSRPNGAMGGARASCRTCISARSIRRAATT